MAPISNRDADRFWELFGTSPLFAKWVGAQARIPSLVEPVTLQEDRVVYEPGDTPQYLFLVIAGKVVETVRHQGRPWLQSEYGPGQFFGQQAIFTNQYQSRAVAQPGTVLYRMSAGDLRIAMEQNPDLAEELLHEKRAGRLRRIPLFRWLSDAQIRQLAQVIEEQDCAEGASLPLAEKPGIWIVDWGQLLVTGPIAAQRPGWAEWGITAGNFLVAHGAGRRLRAGERCTASAARAHVKTHLFVLPIDQAIRLLAAFPEMQAMLRRPVEIVEALRGVSLFGGLSERQTEHLAQFCAWEYVPAGQNITTQGSPGHNLVVLLRGEAVVRVPDEAGRSRPHRNLHPGHWYGKTSLLEGKPREATVRAVKAPPMAVRGGEAPPMAVGGGEAPPMAVRGGEAPPMAVRGGEAPGEDAWAPTGSAVLPVLDGAEVVLLDRRDLQFAFSERPDLWHPGVPLYDQMVRETEVKRRFDWLDEGEVVRWADRAHIFWLLGPELGLLLLGLLAYLLLRLAPASWQGPLSTVYLVCGLPILMVVGLWVLINYYDDYYVVTNLRVTRHDRVWPIYEAKVQAPIDTVQQTTVNASFWGRLFDYGDVSINTAAKVGAMVFAHVPAPERVQGYVLQGKAEALLAGRGQQREGLRRGLATELWQKLTIPERTRALGEGVRPPRKRGPFSERPGRPAPSGELLPGTPRPAPQWLVRLASRLPERLQKLLVGPPRPAPQPLSGQIIWRKHWMNLLGRTLLPGLSVLVLLILAWGGAPLLRGGLLGFGLLEVALPWLFLLVVAVGWLVYHYVDWHNDIYVITDDKLIDIEARPLGLYIKRRESGLDRVQTVDYKQEGIIRNLFNYGDVVIRTAAADEGFDFLYVPNPRLVQAIIFQKLETFRRQQERRRVQERQREMIEGLQIYHELQQES